MFKIMTGTRDPTDLLQRFSCGGEGILFPSKPKEEYGRPENVELTLGLSLNGRFGLEPHRSVANDDNNIKKKLLRASSVTNFVNFPVDVELSLYSPLTRTCSLPPETEAEWRRRKDLQSLRRSEAKRKRVEKLKNLRVVKGKTWEDSEPNGKNSGDGVELPRVGMIESPPSPSPPASTSPPPAPPLRFPSQGSIGSQGSGGSSGVSELDSQPSSGTNRDTSDANVERSNPTIGTNERRAGDQMMPCVTTKGEGPDGKRIQGFLYRYGKGEEVRIVCVCHGSFLTPAEFVKHSGGGDVEHPLRHIVVTSLFS